MLGAALELTHFYDQPLASPLLGASVKGPAIQEVRLGGRGRVDVVQRQAQVPVTAVQGFPQGIGQGLRNETPAHLQHQVLAFGGWTIPAEHLMPASEQPTSSLSATFACLAFSLSYPRVSPPLSSHKHPSSSSSFPLLGCPLEVRRMSALYMRIETYHDSLEQIYRLPVHTP